MPTPPAWTALIADDEEGPREQLLAALRSAWPGLQVLAVAANGVDAWDAFLEHEPAVCFLDIRMPGLSGIDVARRIGHRAAVVFVSAHGDHALAAFDAGAVDYVLKPVDPQRLTQAVQRLQLRASSTAAPAAAAASATAPTTGHGASPATGPDTGRGGDLQQLLAQLAAQVRRPAPLAVLQAGVGREVRLIRTDEVVSSRATAATRAWCTQAATR